MHPIYVAGCLRFHSAPAGNPKDFYWIETIIDVSSNEVATVGAYALRFRQRGIRAMCRLVLVEQKVLATLCRPRSSIVADIRTARYVIVPVDQAPDRCSSRQTILVASEKGVEEIPRLIDHTEIRCIAREPVAMGGRQDGNECRRAFEVETPVLCVRVFRDVFRPGLWIQLAQSLEKGPK